MYVSSSTTFGDGFFKFQVNKLGLKQDPGHNHANTIFQLGQCSFNQMLFLVGGLL